MVDQGQAFRPSGRLRLDDAQRRVLQSLRDAGPLSRVGIAGRLATSATVMTALSRSLLDLGLVEETPTPLVPGRGRPAVPLKISPGGGYSLGVAVHRGFLEMLLLDYAGGLIASHAEDFDEMPPRACARRVRARLHAMIADKKLLGARFLGVGFGVPGPRRPGDDGRWIIVRTLAGWRDEPLASIFADELGCPAWIENDANCAALAEHYLGGRQGQGSTSLVILLGHGLGAGVVADGRLLSGAAGNAGDIGCLFPPDRERPSTIDLLATLSAGGCEARSVTDVEAAMARNPDLIEAWVDRAARQLRSCIDAGVAWLNPGRVVISSPLPTRLLQRLAARIGEAGWHDGYYAEYPVAIECSGLGGAAIAMGAALLPIHLAETAG